LEWYNTDGRAKVKKPFVLGMFHDEGTEFGKGKTSSTLHQRFKWKKERGHLSSGMLAMGARIGTSQHSFCVPVVRKGGTHEVEGEPGGFHNEPKKEGTKVLFPVQNTVSNGSGTKEYSRGGGGATGKEGSKRKVTLGGFAAHSKTKRGGAQTPMGMKHSIAETEVKQQG